MASPLLRPATLRLASTTSTDSEGEVVEIPVDSRKKRKATSPVESGAGMEKKMDEILANMATSKDVDRLTKKMEGRLNKIESRQDNMLERIENLEREKIKSNAKVNKTEQRLKRLTEDGNRANKAPGQESDAKAYELARKQLVLCPVSPDPDTVKIFLERQMEMDPEAVRSLDIVRLKRQFKRPGRKGDNGCQTIVTFGTVDERDLVISHSANLPKGCSVDLVIPDYLQSLKRYLDRFAFKVCRHARDAHQTKFSTSVRMDDIERTLYLSLIHI